MKARLMEHAIMEFLRGLKWCEVYIMLGFTADLVEKRHARGLKKCRA
jgi:hypothetical protein